MEDWNELLQELSRNVMAAGRMLGRRPAFTYEELSALRDTLKDSAKTVQIIQSATTKRPA